MKQIAFNFFIIFTLMFIHNCFVESSVIQYDDKSIKNNETISEEMQYIMNIIQSLNQTQSRSTSRKNNKTKSPQIPPINSDPVQTVQSRIPCECNLGICSCCVGGFIFNNKGCIKLRYIPEDFAFEVRMTFNKNTLYKNIVSGKNPRPICISPPRFDNFVEICAKFHDIYFVGRNMHICLDLAGSIGDFDLFDREFDCMKFGTEGVSLVPPGTDHPGVNPGTVINAGTDAEIDAANGSEFVENYDEVVG